jgi:phosphoribosyl-ATP pyrophosphohydrolase
MAESGLRWIELLDGLGLSPHFLPVMTAPDTLARLAATIAARRHADPATSWVAKLHARGLPVIARKLGEEAVETITAALAGTHEELVGEAADTIFHLLVLLDAKGVALDEVLAELDRREGTSGIAEKASRSE